MFTLYFGEEKLGIEALDSKFGGAYLAYYHRVRKYLGALVQEGNFEVILVFDGASVEEMKDATTRKRHKDRCRKSEKIAMGSASSYDCLLPLMIRETFRQAVRDSPGISSFTADGEVGLNELFPEMAPLD